MPGPPRTPTKTLKLRGSWHAATRTGEPEPQAGSPPMPPGLTEREADFWQWLCEQLGGMGLLHACDMPTFMIAVEAWEEFWTSREAIVKHGAVSESKTGGEYQHPNVGRKNKALLRLQWAIAQLGLSPAARARIRVESEKETAPNKARFFAS